MEIRFRDVSSGIVEARAVITIAPGVLMNEVTIIRRNGELEVELPQKSFKGKDGKFHYLDIITFENENKQTLWELEIREAYEEWRRQHTKVRIYNAGENDD